jgi:glycine/D-amino acid oxidase-like deaminating enzyme
MATLTADAVVVGGGPHGLVAAALLADAGWDVCLLEATDGLGGAVRSTSLHPGFVTDLFSAFYPLYAVSPVLRALELEAHGLRWSHAPAMLARPPRPDGERAAVLYRDREAMAARLAEEHPGDGDAWLALCRQWDAVSAPLLRAIGTGEALRLARFLLLPARRTAAERPRVRRSEPRLRRGQRRHRAAVPAAGVPAGARARPTGDRHRQPLPRRVVGPPGRRRARDLRRARRAGGAASGRRARRPTPPRPHRGVAPDLPRLTSTSARPHPPPRKRRPREAVRNGARMSHLGHT